MIRATHLTRLRTLVSIRRRWHGGFGSFDGGGPGIGLEGFEQQPEVHLPPLPRPPPVPPQFDRELPLDDGIEPPHPQQMPLPVVSAPPLPPTSVAPLAPGGGGTSPPLSESQELAVRLAVDEGKSLLLMGPAGTGKSLVIKEIKVRCEAGGRRVAVTATTGVAIGGTSCTPSCASPGPASPRSAWTGSCGRLPTAPPLTTCAPWPRSSLTRSACAPPRSWLPRMPC